MAQPPDMQIDETTVYRVTIATDRGPIVMDLDPRLAPRSVNNFVALARDGYYDGLTFHRVEPGFVIQGGCPEGSGRGGPGYKFADEPVQGDYTPGAVAMANAGPDTNGSQFFVCLEDLSGRLPEAVQPVRSRDRGHGRGARREAGRRDEHRHHRRAPRRLSRPAPPYTTQTSSFGDIDAMRVDVTRRGRRARIGRWSTPESAWCSSRRFPSTSA